MRLTSKVRQMLIDDLPLRQGLAVVAKVSERTIYNRAKSNSPLLTTVDCYEHLKKETGLSKAEILTTEIIATDPGDEVEHIMHEA